VGSLPFRYPLHRPATLEVSSDRSSTMTRTVLKASKRNTTHTRRQHEQQAHAPATHRQPTPLWRTGCRGSNSTLCATALPSEHAHATRSTVADRRLSQLAAAYALWMLFSGVGAQQPTAVRRCGSFRIAAVQLLSEAVDVERGRFSKIRARLSTRLLALSTTSVTQGHGSQRRGHEVSGQNPTFINHPPLRTCFLVSFF